ncbi:MAG: PSD1 and planctomycete cytochrome C domain-containing protein, partial [Planctomycetota bacterium]|nr:PSD1 and planctomycete cytochrome C domain-containing protein [Planctomycetota bacterium]
MLSAIEILVFALVLGTETPQRVTFEEDIRPIFKAYCFDCHGATEKLKGGLDLRLKKFAQKGGKSGSSLKENDPEHSHLLQRIKSGEMPPSEKKVPPEKIVLIERWLKNGAPTLRAEPDTLPPGIGITEEERNYWFYKPLLEPKVPDIILNQKKLAPLDAFILTKLKQKKIGFNQEADKRTLIRRAYLDLTGLPPTIEQVERFEKNSEQNAYETLIDELLASPAYGERWARHWLDVAGYADTEGDSPNDSLRPHIYKYRDYVIRALNSDKPFNQFIIEQLAGDELAPKPWDELSLQARELLAATGFLRCGPDITAGGGAIAEAEQTFTESIKIISSGLLGLSVGCAQCHDHRYDPISQVDYFRFRAIFEPAFNPSQWRKPAERTAALMTKPDREKSAQIEKVAQELASKLQAETNSTIKVIFEKELQKIPPELHVSVRAAIETAEAKRTPEQKILFEKYPKINVRAGIIEQYDPKAMAELKKAQTIIDAKRAEKPKEDFYAIMSEVPSKIPATKLFYRGDYRQPLQDIIPGDLSIATVHEAKQWDCPTITKGESSGRRLAFAQHLTSGKHPQFNRTMANRIWVYHFGQGIVDTPGEFGKLGTAPSQPELLDWLALQLPKSNWSLKAFHKLIMTSTTYRQSSVHRP